MVGQTVFFVLNEINFFYVIWRVLRKQKTCIITTRSLLFGRKSRVLERIVKLFHYYNIIQILEKDRADLVLYPFFGDLIRSTDVFGESEIWLEKRLCFSESENWFGDYAIAYRHVCSSAAFERYSLAYLIYGILKANRNNQIKGLDDFDIDFLNYRFKEISLTPQYPSKITPISNVFLLILATMYTIFSIFIRIRIPFRLQASFHLGSDFVQHPTNSFLWEEVSDRKDDVLVVFRSHADQKIYKNKINGRPYTTSTDGYFSFKGGLLASANVLKAFIQIFCNARKLPSDFLRRLISLPYRCAMYRGLFNRFHCNYFWGRDDYNPEHSLRSVELRKKNAVSLGYMHGIPSIAPVVHQLRHLDFDIYHTAGNHHAEKYYKKWWPKHMIICPIGSLGVSRKHFLCLMQGPQEKNVACFLSVSQHVEDILLTIDTAARAFPTRTFYIHWKYKAMDNMYFKKSIQKFLIIFPPNVECWPEMVELDDRRGELDDTAYDLIAKCDTVLSTGSTLAAEGIQFGRNSFVLDYNPRIWKSSVYRDFPGVCIKKPEDLIARLTEIDNNSWKFPKKQWKEFIDISGDNPWDKIRKNLGLDPK